MTERRKQPKCFIVQTFHRRTVERYRKGEKKAGTFASLERVKDEARPRSSSAVNPRPSTWCVVWGGGPKLKPLYLPGKWSVPHQASDYPLTISLWSGRRGSNPRPSAWKADALPTELLPLKSKHEPWPIEPAAFSKRNLLDPTGQRSIYYFGVVGFEPTQPKHWIYSPAHLSNCGAPPCMFPDDSLT